MEDFNLNIGNESLMVKKMVSAVANFATSKDLSVKCTKLLGRVLMGRRTIRLPDFDI
jgi:hypothetical protein